MRKSGSEGRCGGWPRALGETALLAVVVAGVFGNAWGEERGGVLAPPVEVSVEAGGRAGIEMRAFFTERPGLLKGAVGRETDFVLVGQPRFGAIEEVRQLPRIGDRDTATAVYRHKAEAGGLLDDARFEVRDARDGAVLATLPVTIRILRGILKVEPGGRLWLGDCVVGDSVEGVVTLENTGGAPLSLQVAAWRPFYVESSGRQIYLAPGARVPIRYQFHPETPGFFETPLILKPDLIQDYTIEAKAVEAVTLSTNRLDFGGARVGASVRLPLLVRNRARTMRQVEVQLSGAFGTELPSVRIPAQGEAEIGVIFRPTATGEASGWAVVRDGEHVVRCQLAGDARVGPDLAIAPGPFIQMGAVTGLSSGLDCRLVLTNRGDMAWEGMIVGGGHFKPDETEARIAPGEMGSLNVRYRPSIFGAHTGAVMFVGPTTAGVTLAALSVVPSAARLDETSPVAPLAPPTGSGVAAPAAESGGAVAGGGMPAIASGDPGPLETDSVALPTFDLDTLPVFEPPNFRASALGDGGVIVEWDPSPELPLERLDFWERRFRPLAGGGSGIVWSRRVELPQLSPDRRVCSITLRGLPGGWTFEFALAESDPAGKPLRRTPIIEIETAAPGAGRRVPWNWIAAAACAALVVLHFVGARFRR